jgi:uncharacterized protein (DUF58 family)
MIIPSFRTLWHRDYSPDWTRRLRAQLRTPLALVLLASCVAILAGLVIHPRVFALAGGLLAIAALGVCWPWLTCRGVRATIAFDRTRTIEHEEVGVTATVTNHLPWPSWGLSVREHLGALHAKLPRIAGRSKSVCRWVFVAPGRGVYPQHETTVGTGFPFGMKELSRRCDVATELVVWPRTYPVGPVPTSEGADVVEGNVTRNKVGTSGDVLGVRPYRRGDSPRRIHWAQSARHDRLIVCELQSHSRPVVHLILDANTVVHTLGSQGSREWAFRVVASLAKGWLEAGAQVGLVVGTTYLSPQAGLEHLTRVLDAIACEGDTSTTLNMLMADPRVRGATAGVSVVVTTDVGRAAVDERLDDVRWVLLEQHGFGGVKAHTPTRPWLQLPSPDRVPDLLRHGTPEASHGS